MPTMASSGGGGTDNKLFPLHACFDSGSLLSFRGEAIALSTFVVQVMENEWDKLHFSSVQ